MDEKRRLRHLKEELNDLYVKRRTEKLWPQMLFLLLGFGCLTASLERIFSKEVSNQVLVAFVVGIASVFYFFYLRKKEKDREKLIEYLAEEIKKLQ